jgi:hypothetical protein
MDARHGWRYIPIAVIDRRDGWTHLWPTTWENTPPASVWGTARASFVAPMYLPFHVAVQPAEHNNQGCSVEGVILYCEEWVEMKYMHITPLRT